MNTADRRWIVRQDTPGDHDVEQLLLTISDLPVEGIAEHPDHTEIYFARQSEAAQCAALLGAAEPTPSAPGNGEVFGSQSHPTTQLILNLIPAWIRPLDYVADIGSGTGILAAKAARTAQFVIAADIDKPAIRATRATLGGTAYIIQGSADALAPSRFHLILANLHLSVWRQIAPEIARIAAPNARILASGFLADQEFEVRTLFSAHGFSVDAVRSLEGWLAVRASKPV